MTTEFDQLYTESANLGTFMSLIYLIGAIVIGVILVICAILNFTAPTYKVTSATIVTLNCVNNETKNSSNKCTLTLSYNIENKSYIENLIVNVMPNDNKYYIGQIIDIQYLPSDPTRIQSGTTNTITLGIVSLVITLIIIGATGLNYYITSHNKIYAGSQGIKIFMNNI